MDYQTLATELADAAYTGLSDEAAADALNAIDATKFGERMVTYRAILAEVDGAGDVLDAIEAAGATNADVKWAMIGIKADGIDIGHPKTMAMVDALVAGSVLTQAQGDALKGMAPNISRATELGLGTVKVGDVQFARSI